MSEEIIAAIATPPGEGGISVIRISGSGVFECIDRLFAGREPLSSAASHTAHFGVIQTAGGPIDQVVATLFRAPHSYTGEDSIELSCHGGLFVTRRILDAVIASGCSLARPGEFTERAFLNGRIDLVQAEAVADLIHAGGEAARRSSFEQLQGTLSRELRGMREELIRITGLMELELDFVEEDIELASRHEISKSLRSVLEKIGNLIGSYAQGRVYREGVRSVIAGKPNAGKSSLLNALLKHDRAIVSVTPGTTRDTIEESILIDGVLFRLTDTAGLRPTSDEIEIEGIARATKEIQRADIVIMVIDTTKSITDIEKTIENFRNEWIPGTASALIAAPNKIDLIDPAKKDSIVGKLSSFEQIKCVPISAKTGEGIESLEKEMIKSLNLSTAEGSITLTNARHKNALMRAEKSLLNAIDSVEHNKSDELVVIDLRGALNCIGEITGETTTDDILNAIFSLFCIGK